MNSTIERLLVSEYGLPPGGSRSALQGVVNKAGAKMEPLQGRPTILSDQLLPVMEIMVIPGN